MAGASKWARNLLVVAVIGVAMPLAALAGGGGGGRGGGQINANQLLSGQVNRVQAQVGFSDEEWSVVQPRLTKVVGLQAQSGKGGIGQLVGAARGGGRGGRGGGGAGLDINALIDQAINNGQPSLVTQKHNELQAALDDPNTPPQTILIKMTEYRNAMNAARQALVKAQAELQAVLTIRQEAMLMSLGYLD